MKPYYTVTLCSRGNPDFGQNPKRPVSPFAVVAVETLADAARVVRQYIKYNDLGGGNWVGNAGTLKDNTGRVIGRVAYNGNIFGVETVPGDWKSAPLLYQPDGGLPHLHD